MAVAMLSLAGTIIPLLAPLVRSASEIVKLVDDVKHNKDRCLALAQRAGSIILAVIDATNGMNEEDLHTTLLKDINDLGVGVHPQQGLADD
ncbi:hypothetical protein AcV5_007202 [Taiwanofungus camphoratus]|nr:hypothetical protein AcV5_007202 [Antrodia cinnamomea]